LARRISGNRSPRWIEADELVDQPGRGGIAVIDVRGPHEFVGPLGHISHALNLPIGELPSRLMEINALKDKPVALVCRTDRRSAMAAALLRNSGFRDVQVLRGGIEAGTKAACRWRAGRDEDG
jgi:rhodanese-related sulfurtransferase